MNWSDLGDWWRAELESDPAYESVVTPLLSQILQPGPGRHYLDLGCGEGRLMRNLAQQGAVVHGIDLNLDLARSAGNAIVARLPDIPLRSGFYDGVYSVLTLEHLADHERFFSESARVTRREGTMAIVINHPIWTAPDSTPITDVDGEVLWRPGRYFPRGSSDVPARGSSVTFHHRSMGDLLNAAAEAGWCLQQLIERPHHQFEDQSGIPRLLAGRWSLLP